MSLFNEASKKSESIGQWQPHPLGHFTAVFDGIRMGDHQGSKFYEISMRTTEGSCKTTVWETWESEVQGRLLQLTKGDLGAAQKKYVDSMSRTLHLYNVAGLPRPEQEADAYRLLGGLVGKPCEVEVRANPKDDRNPYINVYPPNSQAKAAPNGSHPALSAQPVSAFDPSTAPALENIPF